MPLLDEITRIWDEQQLPPELFDHVKRRLQREEPHDVIRSFADERKAAMEDWRTETGEQWTPHAGPTWTPPGWQPPTYEIDLDARQEGIDRMNRRIEKLKGDTGPSEIDQNQIALLEARDMTAAREAHESALSRKAGALEEVNRLDGELTGILQEAEQQALDYIQAASTLSPVPVHVCPHCQGGLSLTLSPPRVEGWVPPDAEAEAAARGVVNGNSEAQAEIDRREALKRGELQRARETLGQRATEVKEAQAEVDRIQGEIDGLRAQQPSEIAQREIESLRHSIESSERDTACYRRWESVMGFHRHIVLCEAIEAAIHDAKQAA